MRDFFRRCTTALIAQSIVVSLAVSGSNGQSRWTVTLLHPTDASGSKAQGVDGAQQVGDTVFQGVLSAGWWSGTASSWTSLNPEGMLFSFAFGVHDGQQVGSAYTNDFSPRASLWHGTAASWVNLNPIGASQSGCYDVHDGQQVGYVVNGIFRASLWKGTAASWVDLNPVGSTLSQARGVHNGQQVGYARFDGVRHAGLWQGTADSWVDLHPAGAAASNAWGIYMNTQVGDVAGHAALWTGSAESWVDLHPAPATDSFAESVHGDFQVGKAQVAGRYRASLWKGPAESWEDLSQALTGSWDQTFAQSVWSDATTLYVAGYGMNMDTRLQMAILWTRPISQCIADITGDNVVNVADLLALISAWGPCKDPNNCPSDIDPVTAPSGNGLVNVGDLLMVISGWGQCG